MQVFSLKELAEFRGDKMAKVDVVSSPRLICGLNCFEPGQTRKVTLVPYRGTRQVFGFNQKIMGPLD